MGYKKVTLGTHVGRSCGSASFRRIYSLLLLLSLLGSISEASRNLSISSVPKPSALSSMT